MSCHAISYIMQEDHETWQVCMNKESWRWNVDFPIMCFLVGGRLLPCSPLMFCLVVCSQPPPLQFFSSLQPFITPHSHTNSSHPSLFIHHLAAGTVLSAAFSPFSDNITFDDLGFVEDYLDKPLGITFWVVSGLLVLTIFLLRRMIYKEVYGCHSAHVAAIMHVSLHVAAVLPCVAATVPCVAAYSALRGTGARAGLRWQGPGGR